MPEWAQGGMLGGVFGGTSAMAGRKSSGNFESCGTAFRGTQELLQRMTENGKYANALHAIQDAWPLGHFGFLPWGGFFYWPPGTDPGVHFPTDDRFQDAVDASWYYLRDLRQDYFDSPTWFLPNSCQQ